MAECHGFFISKRTGGLMKKISQYIMERFPFYLLGLFCLCVSVLLDMISPQLTKSIIDDVITDGKIELLPKLLVGILLIGVGRTVFLYARDYTFDLNGAQIIKSMRLHLYQHLQGLSTDFYDRNNTGELMARVKDDIDRVGDALIYVVMLLLEVVIHVSMILFFMFHLDPLLTILPVVVMIFCGWLAIFMEKRLDTLYEEMSEENAVLTTCAQENIAGVRTVKAFGREKFEIHKFLSHNRRYCELSMNQSNVFVKYHPLFHLITGLLPLLVLLIGGFQVIQGTYSLGTLGAFIEYSLNIVWPMEMLGWLANSLSSAVASHRKIKTLYDETASIADSENPTILPRVQGDVVFDHVSFQREHSLILHDVSFHIKAGQTLGIMGATGSGKSSLILLLQRMHDCSEGCVRIDGVDIRDLSLQQLRSSICAVMQDVFLFSETVGYNVKLGKQDLLSEDQVRLAAHSACAGEFVEKLKDRYDTIIGERGVGLSGGQKQRLTIARALAGKAPILVLDDSTSALDMETEQEIHNTLYSLEGITKIIIAHRISAVRKADHIIYLKNASIAEEGTHDELLKKQGLYYETYVAQYGEP
jgi:ATP-binding cassette subfamily B protein